MLREIAQVVGRGFGRDFESDVRAIERVLAVRSVVRRAIDAFEHRGERYALGRLMAAVERSRETLDRSDTAALSTLEDYALALAQRGELRRALAANSKVAQAYTQILGPLDPLALCARHRNSWLAWRVGELDTARLLAQELLDDCSALDRSDPIRLGAMAGLALILADIGDLGSARALQLACVNGRASSLGEEHPATLRCGIDLFMTLVQLGERENAAAVLQSIAHARGASARIRHGVQGSDVWDLFALNVAELRSSQALDAVLETGVVPSRRTFPRDLSFEL